MRKYERGSEWRKWDLHLHSINTYLGNNFSDISKDDFVKKIVNSHLAVVGLTNYFRFSENDFMIMKELKDKQITVFPNLEFRTQQRNNENEEMHLHIIFSEKVTEENILSFLGRLKTIDEKYCSELNEDDIKSTTVSFETIKAALEQDSSIKQYEDYLLIACPRGQGNFRPSKNGGRGDTTAIAIDNWSDILFGKSDDTEFFLNESRYEGAKRKPVLLCSDAHQLHTIGEKFTWIKADPTFEGLKQIIYEPEERVYIGEKPPILSKVENNKTKYIKSLEIKQANENHTGDIWFKDISIPFNNELIAIIGNKGSGKSSIADVLGLVGDTHTDKQYFSFLHEDKFLKNGLANQFTAKITWGSDGVSGDVSLGADLKKEKPELVRFLPQNYFEELTNELEIIKFQDVLENIIFEYIPDNEKLGKSNFKELEAYKAGNVNAEIQNQKNKIQDINEKIINLEKKKHPDYLKKIKGQIDQKNIEIEAQEKLLKELPAPPNPNNKDSNSEQQNKIAEYSASLDIAQQNLADKKKDKSILTDKIEALRQLKQKIKFQEQSVKEFLQNHEDEAKEHELNINEILKIEANYSSINEKIRSLETELKNLAIFFETVDEIEARKAESNNESIVYKIHLLSEKLKSETDKLTDKEKEYQDNEQRKKSIDETIQKLKGTPENPSYESLESYKQEKEFIEHELKIKLKGMREGRIEISLDIFQKKNELIELYNSFKLSVDKEISKNRELLDDYDIKIDSSFNLDSNFYGNFLTYINQRKRGCFQGIEEGENKIKSIIEDSGFSDEGNIRSLLTVIIDSLEEGNAVISDQVSEDKLNSFYDYVFSLDYLSPKYELKLSGKILKQLSPGERGALLLIFYLMIDKEKIPLVIDQPEDNLDNESVYKMLSKFIKKAKKERQIIMVTHNPNLAVGADAEQIICVSIKKTNKNKFSFISGSIEDPEINQRIVQILEGTKPAFDKRKLKYQDK